MAWMVNLPGVPEPWFVVEVWFVWWVSQHGRLLADRCLVRLSSLAVVETSVASSFIVDFILVSSFPAFSVRGHMPYCRMEMRMGWLSTPLI